VAGADERVAGARQAIVRGDGVAAERAAAEHVTRFEAEIRRMI
jgi:hypothetical protein